MFWTQSQRLSKSSFWALSLCKSKRFDRHRLTGLHVMKLYYPNGTCSGRSSLTRSVFIEWTNQRWKLPDQQGLDLGYRFMLHPYRQLTVLSASDIDIHKTLSKSRFLEIFIPRWGNLQPAESFVWRWPYHLSAGVLKIPIRDIKAFTTQHRFSSECLIKSNPRSDSPPNFRLYCIW